MPCTSCLLSPHLATHAPASPSENPSLAPAPQLPDGTDLTPQGFTARYQEWGWPVTLHQNQVRLSLGADTMALLISVSLAGQLTAILRHRRCLPPVLAHPYAPEHQVLLAGERYGMELPWPPDVAQVTGTLLLPPTMTARGPITWVYPPEPDALTLCREVDVITAVRAVQRGSPPAAGPLPA